VTVLFAWESNDTCGFGKQSVIVVTMADVTFGYYNVHLSIMGDGTA